MEAESIFIEVFGKNPMIRILDFLITFQAFDYPLTAIAEKAGVSYSTLQMLWPKLEKNNLVIVTRKVGKSSLFKLNTSHPAIKQLIRLDWNLIKGSEVEEVIV